MLNRFPPALQKIIDEAVLHLWDENYPRPDLDTLSGFLEVEGWDLVVDGSNGSCISTDELTYVLNDETLIEHTDITSIESITNADRIAFTRGHLEHLLSESMDSFHSIAVEAEKMPPAELCFTMYFHPQGGATFYGIEVAHSSADYIESYGGEIILEASDLTDKKILDLWKKSEAKIKAWRKSLSKQ
jgi:hypothetical protein